MLRKDAVLFMGLAFDMLGELIKGRDDIHVEGTALRISLSLAAVASTFCGGDENFEIFVRTQLVFGGGCAFCPSNILA